jgi:mannose-6-phosphate isomerase-like protein (cupin superfamily)
MSSNGKFHFHKEKDETFYIIKGVLLLDIIGNQGKIESYKLRHRDSFRIEPNVPHRFSTTCLTSCTFIEVSTFHDDNDSYYGI